MILKLRVQTKRKGGRTFVIRPPEGTIGRAHGNAVRIPSNDVSRKHCRLCIQDAIVTVEDLESLNGTFLNRERVVGVVEVLSGDALRVGPVTFEIQFEQPKDVPIEDQDVDVELITDPAFEQTVEEESFGVELFPEHRPVKGITKPSEVPTRKHSKPAGPPGRTAKKRTPKKDVRDNAPIPLAGDKPGNSAIPLAGSKSAGDADPTYVEFDQAWIPPDSALFRDMLEGLEGGENLEGDSKK
jgi:pSer/pThr/pTyr-binding forkhead associated (FHA) protein